jgi:alcohol dehydrogenase (cytochrome c)
MIVTTLRSTAIAVAALAAASLAPPAAAQRAKASYVDPPTVGWPTNGGDWFNRRHSPLTQIDRSNVAQLKGVWRTQLDGSGMGPKYSGEAQPLVVDGVVYVSTGANDVFAIDVDTGQRLWGYLGNLEPQNITTVCCGWTNRGVAYGEGKVFQGQLDGKLVALDAKTGKVAWSTQAERWQDGFTITSAPLYYDGLVITGFAGAELGVRGRVKAYDARDGKLVWTFYTVPGPGEPGHETWSQDNDIWMNGGGTVWQTPAVDPELGLIYFSTGNPGPDFNGAVRKGDNLYTSSIVAIEAKTGKYRWHFQQVHHDLWDYDSANPVVLFDTTIGGRPRKGLYQGSKTGWLYFLDRTDGTPLIGIDEKPVPQEPRQATAATQPYPRGDSFSPQFVEIPPEGYTLVNGGRIFTPYWTDYVIAKPGINGGLNWPPTSYDPTSGYVFVCAGDGASAFRAWDIDDAPPPVGEMYIGGDFGPNPLPRLGTFTAMDSRTNKIVWQHQWSEPCFNGIATTAAGLLFTGRTDGRVTALDSRSGELLWEFQTGAGVNSPVSVFGHEGKQYVVAYSAGHVFAGSSHGDSVWLFALDGTLEPVPAGK